MCIYILYSMYNVHYKTLEIAKNIKDNSNAEFDDINTNLSLYYNNKNERQ